jgi:2-polyprenyl-3-methyl-5-hydroxy-6-metoxy-1,4-benzoquinol methylase
MRVLEVGCGNGFSTDRFRSLVEHIDAFDYAGQMIERAKRTFGETNNRFIHDSVLRPQFLEGPYDAVICVRVLINLADLEQQKQALANITRLVRPDGICILAEGFTDGFDSLNALRTSLGLPALTPVRGSQHDGAFA